MGQATAEDLEPATEKSKDTASDSATEKAMATAMATAMAKEPTKMRAPDCTSRARRGYFFPNVLGQSQHSAG